MAWYEETGPSREDIHNILYKSLIKNRKGEYLNDAITDVLQKNEGYGSWRGYYTFVHNELQDMVINEYRIGIIKRFIINCIKNKKCIKKF